eukprot:m.4807 g.4807  ORF g.4807 m.4807 type:complete len:447 (+) comp11300_c0_seq1:127-1467(+)
MDVDSVDIAGYTALHTASNHGNFDDILRLLDEGANVNALTLWNETPCHFAARRGYTPVVCELIRAGANLQIRSRGGRNILGEAIRMRHTRTIEYIRTMEQDSSDRVAKKSPRRRSSLPEFREDGTKTLGVSKRSASEMDVEKTRRSSDTECETSRRREGEVTASDDQSPPPPVWSLLSGLIERKDLKLDKRIDMGEADIDVRLGYWKGSKVAIRTVDLSRGLQEKTLSSSLIQLKLVSHPNLVGIFGCCESAERRLRIITELPECTLAELCVAATASGKYLTIRESCYLAVGLVSGLRHLHELSPPIFHGRLKACHVGVTAAMEPKLADWGLKFANGSAGLALQGDLHNLGVVLAAMFSGKETVHQQKGREAAKELSRMLRLRLTDDARCVCSAVLAPDASSPASLLACTSRLRSWMDKPVYQKAQRRRFVARRGNDVALIDSDLL